MTSQEKKQVLNFYYQYVVWFYTAEQKQRLLALAAGVVLGISKDSKKFISLKNAIEAVERLDLIGPDAAIYMEKTAIFDDETQDVRLAIESLTLMEENKEYHFATTWEFYDFLSCPEHRFELALFEFLNGNVDLTIKLLSSATFKKDLISIEILAWIFNEYEQYELAYSYAMLALNIYRERLHIKDMTNKKWILDICELGKNFSKEQVQSASDFVLENKQTWQAVTPKRSIGF